MELTPEQQEEYAARSKEYSRRMMREHHIWQSDLATKLRLKKVTTCHHVTPMQVVIRVCDGHDCNHFYRILALWLHQSGHFV